MAALTGPYPSSQIGGISGPVIERIPLSIADNVHIYQGALVQMLAGIAYPAGTANTADTHTYTTVGRSLFDYDNTVVGHTAGALTVEIAQGAFAWDNGTAGDALAVGDIGANVYAIDDHTVGKTSNSSTRAVAGVLIGFTNDATARPIVSKFI
jgi:hypothetical protein